MDDIGEMQMIDVQIHAYERNHPRRPWQGTLSGPDEMTGEQMVMAFDHEGVAGAILVSPYSFYRYDPDYALQVYQHYPDRFRLVKPFDPTFDDIEEDIQAWAAQDGVVGGRVMLSPPLGDPYAPGIGRILEGCRRANLAVNLLSWHKPSMIGDLAMRHPDVQLVVDHLGITQPFEPPVPDEPFATLKDVLALARFDNVAIKISGVCTLSQRSFPFDDIWKPVLKTIEAFGLGRCMWGTDWTRAIKLVNFHDAVAAFRDTERLSVGDKEALMGGSLRNIYRCPDFCL